MTENFKLCLLSLMERMTETQKLRIYITKQSKQIDFLSLVSCATFIVHWTVCFTTFINELSVICISDIHFCDTVDLPVYKLDTILVNT